MARTLIIKNADFHVNKLAVVSFDTVPCTGITFEEDSYTVVGYDPISIAYTLTPEDTTDELTWESSDETVATIADGVMTIVGVGTCTITATCGEQTATATVSITLSLLYDWGFGYYYVGSGNAVYDSTSKSRITSFGNGVQKGQYKFIVSSSGNPYVIKLPANTNKVTIKRGSDKGSVFYSGSDCAVFWMSDEPAGGSYPNNAKYNSQSTFNMRSNESVSLDVPSGSNAMGIHFRLASAAGASDVAADIASNAGIVVEFSKVS